MIEEEDIMHIYIAFATQDGLDESVKREFWKEMDGLL